VHVNGRKQSGAFFGINSTLSFFLFLLNPQMTSEFPFYHFDDGLKNFLGAGNERENNEQLVSKKIA
jgi:hypothetical protein